MKWIFIVVFAVFLVLEVYSLNRLARQKEKFKLRNTATPAGIFCILVAAVFYFRLDIPFYILTLGVVVLFFNNYFGYYLDFYNKSKKFDRYLHGLGTFVFALLTYYLIRCIMQTGGSKLFLALFIMALGMALGVVNELLEFASDSKRCTRMQKGLRDTDVDLIWDTLGSGAAALFAFFVVL